jgi:hypothetical protein
MTKPVLGPALLVMLSIVLLASTVAIATSLSISAAPLATFTRFYGTPSTCSLQPVADSHVLNGGADADTNYGTLTTLDVRADAASSARALVRFDLSSCSPAIPADAILHEAKLRLTLYSNATATRTYDLHRSTGAWDEATVTWNNQPAVAAGVTSSVTVSSGTAAPAAAEWNVLTDVQDFVSGAATNDGWRLNDSAEDTTVELIFQSGEALSGQPELVITYVD